VLAAHRPAQPHEGVRRRTLSLSNSRPRPEQVQPTMIECRITHPLIKRAPLSPRSDSPISRRDMLRGAAAGVATLALGIQDVGVSASNKPPNILFILAGDLGYADVACYGRPDVRTPNIDRSAANGVRFLQAYANSAVCTATRVALSTGRSPDRLRVTLAEPLANAPDVG